MRDLTGRLILSCLSISTFWAFGACGDDGSSTPPCESLGDVNPGFSTPCAATTFAEDDVDSGEPADWSCLGTPTDDVATAVEITLTGVINDFQNNDNEVNEATVEVFPGIDHTNVVDSFGPTDNTGTYSLTLPTGHTRFGFKVEAPDYEITYLLNQDFEPDGANQVLDISAISTGIATALPAIIGLVRTEGTGILAGAIRDCQNREVVNAVATVSSTSGSPTHLTGAQTYYLDAGAGLPVRNEELIHTDANGIFAVFELPVTGTAYIQVWGFVDDADLADGEMTLLAELPAPVVADTVITGSIEPLRTE
jgi:hypothetical protein